MDINIVNNVASIAINIDADSRTISKELIREISLIRATLLKIDIGGGLSGNIYLPVTDVRTPAHTDANNLCAILNDYLTDSEVELNAQVDEINTKADEINTKVDNINTQADTISTQLADVSTQVNDIDTRVGQIQTLSGDMNTEVGSMATLVADINTQIGQMSNAMDLTNAHLLFMNPLLRDENNPVKIYCGYAPIGTSPSSAQWAILKVWNVGNIISYLWADGNKNFDNVWDNRSALNYS